MHDIGVLIGIFLQLYEDGLPVVAFRFSDQFREENPEIQQKWIQTLLRAKGWIVPNYELPPELETVEILRVVVRDHMTETVRLFFRSHKNSCSLELAYRPSGRRYR